MKFARAHAVEFVFAVAAIISIGVGTLTVWFFENRTERQISEVLKSTGIEWLDIEPDGTLIKLSGVAPNTTLWIQAMNAIQDIVPERRLVNHSSISSASVAQEPDFWLRWLSKGHRHIRLRRLPRRRFKSAVQGIHRESVSEPRTV